MFLVLSLRDAHPPQICCGPIELGVHHICSKGRGLSGKVDDIVMYLIVTCDDKTSVAIYECVTHQKGLHATVVFLLEVNGVNIIKIT